MKKIFWLLAALCWGIPRLPAFSALPGPFVAANRTFRALKAESFVSPVETNGFVFIKVSWKIDQSVSDRERRMLKLKAWFDAISDYVQPKQPVFANSPFKPELTKRLQRSYSIKIHNVPCSTVSDRTENDVRIQILAFDAKTLRKSREQTLALMKKDKPGEKEWLNLLKNLYEDQFGTEEKEKEFFSLLDCPVARFLLKAPARGEGAGGGAGGPAEEEVADFLKWHQSKSSFFARHPNLAWADAVKRDDPLFYTGWKEKDGGAFERAKQAYFRGKSIDWIIGNLVDSIAANPISADKWSFLGGALDVKKLHKDALFAYIQAYKLDPGNSYALQGILRQCRLAGMNRNADGLQWYFKVKNWP